MQYIIFAIRNQSSFLIKVYLNAKHHFQAFQPFFSSSSKDVMLSSNIVCQGIKSICNVFFAKEVSSLANCLAAAGSLGTGGRRSCTSGFLSCKNFTAYRLHACQHSDRCQKAKTRLSPSEGFFSSDKESLIDDCLVFECQNMDFCYVLNCTEKR